ncbi:MAG: hypothetical protein ACKOES_07095 [Planctomycetaceae bacterium]
MYYHCLSLQYVVCGTILPHDDETNLNRPSYEWLGQHCGYCPQIWLSRADITLTGYRYTISPRFNRGRLRREVGGYVLFGFDQIHGFPIDYEFWWRFVLNSALNGQTLAEVDESLICKLEWSLQDVIQEEGDDFDPRVHRLLIGWREERPDLAAFLRKHAFVERDQFVVPSLNLKTAKRILCRNERQKKALRRMGFIEDRIEVRNMPRW